MDFRMAALSLTYSTSTMRSPSWLSGLKLSQFLCYDVSVSRSSPSLVKELADCDCLLLGFQVPIDKDIIDAAPNLKLINILATAYGTVDLVAGFGANVSYWSRSKKNSSFKHKDLNSLLSSCKYISLNVAEAPGTAKLLNKDNLPLIRPGFIKITTELIFSRLAIIGLSDQTLFG